MSDILLRGVSQDLGIKLRERAAHNKRSISDEAQALLRRALVEPNESRGIATEIRNMLAPDGFVDLDLPPRGPDRPPPDFS